MKFLSKRFKNLIYLPGEVLDLKKLVLEIFKPDILFLFSAAQRHNVLVHSIAKSLM